jgi:hypothetical protein
MMIKAFKTGAKIARQETYRALPVGHRQLELPMPEPVLNCDSSVSSDYYNYQPEYFRG